jgi:NAD(P)-dependent dehydrogenase (short-subunit alcohol dehydrogenase family)
MAMRSPAKNAEAVAVVKKELSDSKLGQGKERGVVATVQCDLGSLDSVRSAAKAFATLGSIFFQVSYDRPGHAFVHCLFLLILRVGFRCTGETHSELKDLHCLVNNAGVYQIPDTHP